MRLIITALDFTDSTKVKINNDIDMEFEDLADQFNAGNISIGALVTLPTSANYTKFSRRLNYLMYNNGSYYLKREMDKLGLELYKNGFYAFRVHSYDVKELSE